MEQKINIFGAALDALSSQERVDLKLTYINHLRSESYNKEEFKDPYDFIKANITRHIALNNKTKWTGKISIPSWLTPKPDASDLPKLSVNKLNKFFKSNGYWKYALIVANYIDEEIYPNIPVMIGVDHSLTGGSIMALAKRYPNLNVIILDAHFDVMNKEYRVDETLLNYYQCGNFLDYLLENEIIIPKNLWILGVQDEIYDELNRVNNSQRNLDLNKLSVKKWTEKGVHVIFKKEVQSCNFKVDLNGPTYLSIDMDVGSMSSIYSARFMNSSGLNVNEFLQLLHKISEFIESSNGPFVGLDIMEFDIHFLEITKMKDFNDHTEQIIRNIFKIFVIKNNKSQNKYLL
jgi:arginase family enzyme